MVEHKITRREVWREQQDVALDWNLETIHCCMSHVSMPNHIEYMHCAEIMTIELAFACEYKQINALCGNSDHRSRIYASIRNIDSHLHASINKKLPCAEIVTIDLAFMRVHVRTRNLGSHIYIYIYIYIYPRIRDASRDLQTL